MLILRSYVMKLKIAFLIFITLLFTGFIVKKQLATSVKVFFLVSQEFPQVPIKLLHLFTPQPKREKASFGTKNGKVIADLFIPHAASKNPALIVAMGVRTSEKDKPTLLRFCDTLSRLGYVILWPRLEALEKKEVKIENPQTFISAFNYLEQKDMVDKKRISFIGFSVGSSIAMVAAENQAISEKVNSLVFFGGYFNILDYLFTLASKNITFDDETIRWEPDKAAINHATEILEKEGIKLEQFSQKTTLDMEQKKRILRFSPNHNIARFKASIFILHEKSDTFVPYFESVKLKRALDGKVPLVYHQANLFEHVQVQKGVSAKILEEFAGLFGFLYKVFAHL